MTYTRSRNEHFLTLLFIAAVFLGTRLPLSATPVTLETLQSPRTLNSFLLEQDGHNPIGYHTFSAWNRTESEGFSVIQPLLETSFNSAWQFGMNDRSFWQGRGFNQIAIGGVAFRNSWVDLFVVPEVWWAQNADYSIRAARSGTSPFANYWISIDQPQRMGNQALLSASLGQSSATFHSFNTEISIGTQNVRLGPGLRNNILLSENASGFPHVAVGTYTPWETRLGHLEWKLLWGQLTESDFYDDDPANNKRLLVGGSVSFSPAMLRGFSVSIHRTIHSPWEEAGAYEAFQMFETIWKSARPRDDVSDSTDQALSVAAQFIFPNERFRVYLEWARNDHSSDLNDLLLNPEHTRAYVTGFDYAVPLETRQIQISGEIAVVGPTPTRDVRPAFPWYRHSRVPHGQTNEGQYIGAWIGSGANSQYLSVDLIDPGFSAGMFVERTVFDNDFLFSLGDSTRFDFYTQVAVGLRGEVETPYGRFYGKIAGVPVWNRLWIPGEDSLNMHVAIGFRLSR